MVHSVFTTDWRILAWAGYRDHSIPFKRSNWVIRRWVQLALRARFVQLLQFHVFVQCSRFILATGIYIHTYIATIKSEKKNYQPRNHKGISENTFKKQYANQKRSFIINRYKSNKNRRVLKLKSRKLQLKSNMGSEKPVWCIQPSIKEMFSLFKWETGNIWKQIFSDFIIYIYVCICQWAKWNVNTEQKNMKLE